MCLHAFSRKGMCAAVTQQPRAPTCVHGSVLAPQQAGHTPVRQGPPDSACTQASVRQEDGAAWLAKAREGSAGPQFDNARARLAPLGAAEACCLTSG